MGLLRSCESRDSLAISFAWDHVERLGLAADRPIHRAKLLEGGKWELGSVKCQRTVEDWRTLSCPEPNVSKSMGEFGR